MSSKQALLDEIDDEVLIEARPLTSTDPEDFLTGDVLIAMPQMADPRFKHSVVYLCAHNASGAMGIILNQECDSIDLGEMFEQLDIDVHKGVLGDKKNSAVMNGGPMETSRGFVLHTLDYAHETTIQVTDTIGLTASVDILKAINLGHGPRDYLVALGFAAWSSGQLEDEFNENAWLNVRADHKMLFNIERKRLWNAATAKLGVDPGLLHDTIGNA